MVSLPETITAGSLPSVLRALEEIRGAEGNIVQCDASRVRFVDQLGLCLLSFAMRECAQWKQELSLNGLPAQIQSYMARMNVYANAGVVQPGQFRRHNQAGNLQEVTSITDQSEIDVTTRNLAHAVVGTLPEFQPDSEPDAMTGRRAGDTAYECISYVISELLNNSVTHAKRGGNQRCRAWVAAQHYASRGKVGISVIDDGCGILRSLQDARPRLAKAGHSEAIEMALKPEVSCNRDLGLRGLDTANQGLGLTIIQGIVRRGGGRLFLGSGDALYISNANGAWFKKIPHWKGTLFYAEIPRATLESLTVTGQLGEYRSADDIDVDIDFV